MKKITYILLVFLSTHVMAQDPADIALIFYLDENSPNGTLVGTVSATDPDGDPLTYSITSGNTNGEFAINSTNGNITVNDASFLDFETTPSFSLMVEADDGNGGMTTADITINLNDIDENVLGVEDDQVVMYPNPVSEKLFVSVRDLSARKMDIAIYQMDGGQIPVRSVYHASGEVEIDLTNLTAGVYMLSFQSDALSFKKRFFVK